MSQLALLSTRLAPATRGECEDGPRPCKATTCRYHLWRVDERAGRPHHKTQAWVERALPVLKQWSSETCALDQVDQHREGMTLEQVALVMGLTKQRVQQLEQRALEQVRYAIYVVTLARIAGLEDEVDDLRQLGVHVDDINPDLARAEMVRRKVLEKVESDFPSESGSPA